jgi:hypothetical protein
MGKTLEENILEDLKKTGYPTEIVSAAVMEFHGWAVLHNPSYLDDTEHRSREFDIRAYRTIWQTVGDRKYSFGIYLMTECKKSDKPWVFFTTPEHHTRDDRLGRIIKCLFGGNQLFTDNSNPQSLIPDLELRSFHHYFKPGRLARTFHQPLKGKSESDHSQMIYSAIMSSIKATLFMLREHGESSWVQIFYPVVVFSGPLFEAQVDSNKSIQLTPSEYLQLSFHYIGADEHEFRVDIVHEDYLDRFLTLVEDEHQALAECLESALRRDIEKTRTPR